MKIIEVNVNNENKYLNQIANLEVQVLQNMEANGQIGQLFITGADDISEYIHSKENTVLVSVDGNDRVDVATYITQGQNMFTYNDITKYFKVSDEYESYVKSKYASEADYKKSALDAYKLKLKAYDYARNKVLQEFPEYSSINEFLKDELNSKSKFDEKSPLREKINSYMFEYVKNAQNDGEKDAVHKYEDFYWMTFSKMKDLIYGKDSQGKNGQNAITKELEENLNLEAEYEKLRKESSLIIYNEKKNFEPNKYFSANPQNSIEIDTYITDPNKRSCGKARALVYEGIKKHINNFFSNQENDEIFLCSTLHRDNVSSKYVSEFFDLKDSIFVNRRFGRDREVHITRVKRDEAQEYLKHMAEKLAVLYGYNPENIEISNEKKVQILNEQKAYEKAEFHRLNRIRNRAKRGHLNIHGYSTDTFKMYGNFMRKKLNKIQRLQQNLDDISR